MDNYKTNAAPEGKVGANGFIAHETDSTSGPIVSSCFSLVTNEIDQGKSNADLSSNSYIEIHPSPSDNRSEFIHLNDNAKNGTIIDKDYEKDISTGASYTVHNVKPSSGLNEESVEDEVSPAIQIYKTFSLASLNKDSPDRDRLSRDNLELYYARDMADSCDLNQRDTIQDTGDNISDFHYHVTSYDTDCSDDGLVCQNQNKKYIGYDDLTNGFKNSSDKNDMSTSGNLKRDQDNSIKCHIINLECFENKTPPRPSSAIEIRNSLTSPSFYTCQDDATHLSLNPKTSSEHLNFLLPKPSLYNDRDNSDKIEHSRANLNSDYTQKRTEDINTKTVDSGNTAQRAMKKTTKSSLVENTRLRNILAADELFHRPNTEFASHIELTTLGSSGSEASSMVVDLDESLKTNTSVYDVCIPHTKPASSSSKSYNTNINTFLNTSYAHINNVRGSYAPSLASYSNKYYATATAPSATSTPHPISLPNTGRRNQTHVPLLSGRSESSLPPSMATASYTRSELNNDFPGIKQLLKPPICTTSTYANKRSTSSVRQLLFKDPPVTTVTTASTFTDNHILLTNIRNNQPFSAANNAHTVFNGNNWQTALKSRDDPYLLNEYLYRYNPYQFAPDAQLYPHNYCCENTSSVSSWDPWSINNKAFNNSVFPTLEDRDCISTLNSNLDPRASCSGSWESYNSVSNGDHYCNPYGVGGGDVCNDPYCLDARHHAMHLNLVNDVKDEEETDDADEVGPEMMACTPSYCDSDSYYSRDYSTNSINGGSFIHVDNSSNSTAGRYTPASLTPPPSIASTAFESDITRFDDMSPISHSTGSAIPSQHNSGSYTRFPGLGQLQQPLAQHLSHRSNQQHEYDPLDSALLAYGIPRSNKGPFTSMADKAYHEGDNGGFSLSPIVTNDNDHNNNLHYDYQTSRTSNTKRRGGGRKRTRKNQIQSDKISTSSMQSWKSYGTRANLPSAGDTTWQQSSISNGLVCKQEVTNTLPTTWGVTRNNVGRPSCQMPRGGPRHNEPLRQSAVDVMTRWYTENIHNPYPSKAEKQAMAREGQITENQVKSWFANKRNRTDNTKPKVQRRAMQEKLKLLFKDLKSVDNSCQTDNTHIIQQLSGIIHECHMKLD